MAKDFCSCGRPLHYSDRYFEGLIKELIALRGPTIEVRWQKRIWRVPRHYIALHGLYAADLPSLAEKYGFEEISGG